jgi:hypothetical protein
LIEKYFEVYGIVGGVLDDEICLKMRVGDKIEI